MGEREIQKGQWIQTSCIHPVWHHRFAYADKQLDSESWYSKRIYSDPLISQPVMFGISSKFVELTMRYRKSQCRYMLSTVIFEMSKSPPDVHITSDRQRAFAGRQPSVIINRPVPQKWKETKTNIRSHLKWNKTWITEKESRMWRVDNTFGKEKERATTDKWNAHANFYCTSFGVCNFI